MIGVMELLRDIVRRPAEYSFVSPADRVRCRHAIEKGVECILKTQVKANVKLTAWCAQHDKSGFEASLRDCDVLIVDSAMLPFLQPHWFQVTRRAFQKKGRIRMFDRKNVTLPPVVPSKTDAGWALATEPDGERSYVNSLLTTLAKRTPIPVQLSCGAPLPEPQALATSPEEIEWTETLPFDYGQLNVEEVIKIISTASGIRWSQLLEGGRTGKIRVKLAEGKGLARDVSFRLVLNEGGPGDQSLEIERTE